MAWLSFFNMSKKHELLAAHSFKFFFLSLSLYCCYDDCLFELSHRHISTIIMALPARVLKRSSYDLRSLAEDSPPLQVVVVGIGRMGMPTACMFANAGAFVTGCDTNAHLVKCVERGENYLPDVADLERIFNKVTKNGGFKATTDTTAAVHSAEVAILCLPTPIQEKEGRKVPLYDYLHAGARTVGSGITKGTLVIVESTVGPGIVETVVARTIEVRDGAIQHKSPLNNADACQEESRLRLGKDFLIASSPSRGDASSIITPFEGLPRIVGGCSHVSSSVYLLVVSTCPFSVVHQILQESTNAARQLYESVANKVCCVSNPKTANAVQLAENIFRDVNIGELLLPLWIVNRHCFQL